MSDTRPQASRFQTKYSDAQLLDAVREVIELCGGEHVSQRQFNACRAGAGHPDLPRADSICVRLGVIWAKLQELATKQGASQAIAFGRRSSSSDGGEWITDEQIAFALRLIAKKFGQTSITSAEYRRGRADVIRRANTDALLPDEEQIMGRVGSWTRALELGGLSDPDGDRQDRRNRKLYRALDLCLEHHGAIPSRNNLKKFAIVNRVFLPDNYTPYADALARWRADRTARGLETPEYEPHARPRPDYGRRVIQGRTGRIRSGHWTEERAIAAVKQFLDSRRPGEPTTRKAYVNWSKGNRDAPSVSMIDKKFGGFARVRDLASR